MSDEKTAQELVIIRRRSHGEEEHAHSGLWKIAYADFMTALMAFFLVMWLVNAANKKTLAQVATYFNPMKMSDQITSEKGVNNLAGQDKPAAGKEMKKSDSKDGSGEPEKDVKISNVDEQGIFRDPYGLLAELSKKAATFRRGEQAVPEGGSKNTVSEIYSGGEGYRDPFDPDFRQEPAKTEEIPSDLPVADGTASQKDGPQFVPRKGGNADEKSPEDAKAGETAEKAPGEAKPAVAAEKPATPSAQQPEPAKNAEMASDTKVAGPQSTDAKVAEEARVLKDEIRAMTAQARTPIPKIEVLGTPEGLLVSLMDNAKFGMFAVGSAKPQPELVAVMERIAAMLKDIPGQIIVRGHTDARAYRSKDYDNWRLSTARAHMAHHMLVRGGVDETRIHQIEGHADRDLKIVTDPNAAENRRIEILIKREPS